VGRPPARTEFNQAGQGKKPIQNHRGVVLLARFLVKPGKGRVPGILDTPTDAATMFNQGILSG
jgi:hypothetical protein